ncbi:hypothetical protein PG987_013041 [Apiospora arundinis]
MQSNKVNYTSRQQSIELATGDNDVARLATFAGVFLVLATIHGWLAFFWRTSPDCPANTKCGPDDTAMGFATFFTVAAEVIFTISFFASQPTQEPHTTKRSIYGVIGALLGVQAAILIWSFLIPGPPRRGRLRLHQLLCLHPRLVGVCAGDGIWVHCSDSGLGLGTVVRIDIEKMEDARGPAP